MRATMVLAALVLCLLGQVAQGGVLGRALDGFDDESSRIQQKREQQAREEQAQRDYDDATENVLKKALNDPSWRKDAKPEDISKALNSLQEIQKRKYGFVVTTALPALAPMIVDDLMNWLTKSKQPGLDYGSLAKGFLLAKYGEPALVQFALEWQKNSSTSTPANSKPITWQGIVDELLPQPLIRVTSPATVDTAVTSATASAPASVASKDGLLGSSTAPTVTAAAVLNNSGADANASKPDHPVLPLLGVSNTHPIAPGHQSVYLGRLSSNRYDLESISNKYGAYGSPYGNTLTNPYGSYGSEYSSTAWSNPYGADAPRIYAQDGTYLGKLSSNKYDPESIFNPYGQYGSRYGNNLMNPFGAYGSRFSLESWTNPYTTEAPRIYGSTE